MCQLSLNRTTIRTARRLNVGSAKSRYYSALAQAKACESGQIKSLILSDAQS